MFFDHMSEHQKMIDFLTSNREKISIHPEQLYLLFYEYTESHIMKYDYQIFNNMEVA